MIKRLMDIIASLLGIIVLLPLFVIISLLIILESRGGVFYFQQRVGKNNKDFFLIKFRSMRVGSDKKGLLTVGNRDNRITKMGYFIRKYKIDELPQLLNVLFGSMSLVGPRPEVRKYVDMYSPDQLKVLEVKPGITDYASIKYFNENEVLAKSDDPEKTYIEEVMPKKLELNKKYIEEKSLATDFKIIFGTIGKIFN